MVDGGEVGWWGGGWRGGEVEGSGEVSRCDCGWRGGAVEEELDGGMVGGGEVGSRVEAGRYVG